MSREALFNAVRQGDVAAAQHAIDALQEEDPEQSQEMRLGQWTDDQGSTLPCLAADGGHAALIDLFHSVGMDLTRPNREGNAPVHLAALRCRPAVIRSLARAAVDLTQENSGHRAPAHIAAGLGWVPVMDELLAAGVDLSARTSQEQWSPMDMAASRGHLQVLARLLDAGLDPDARDVLGRTAAQYAARSGQMDVLDFLIERGVPMPRSADAWWGQHTELFDVFQQRVNRAAVGVCIRDLEAHGGEWANQATRLQCPFSAQPFSMSGRRRPVEVPGGDPLNPYVVTADAFRRLMLSTARHPLTGRQITAPMLGAFEAPGGGFREGHSPTLRALERVCDIYLVGGEAHRLAERGRLAHQALAASPVAQTSGHFSNFMNRRPASSSRAGCCTVS